jgi:uncharacterized protein with NAD-binding domain and iron-sulfur cluster
LDRVLDGPTSEVWIDPWVELLSERGVVLRGGCVVGGIHCNGRTVTSVTVEGNGRTERIVADHYVAAMPVEKLRPLVSELLSAEPRLAGLPLLTTRWMNGAMFYLDGDVPLVNGHAIFIDSEWSLTAISQKQFWRDIDLEQRGDGRVEGILSVDVSEWERPGKRTGKIAMACSRDEIRAEVWGQLTDHIDDGSLNEANVVDWFLDPAITFPNPTGATNCEPLLINKACSWANRPCATTKIPNFFLAADFVRTNTDLATMEAANEAARRAVNGILDATGSTARRCKVHELREPEMLRPFRALDRLRWRLGRGPAKPPIKITPDGQIKPSGPVARGMLAAARFTARQRNW